MNKSIHPTYYEKVEFVCACGNKIITGSTLPGPVRVEICSHCHPFFTGEKKLVDSEGRVDRYKRQVRQAEKVRAEQENMPQAKRKAVGDEKQKPRTLTLKELLEETRK